MTVFALQLVAMVTMLIDHLGSPIMDNNLYMRCIGRFAFPIYALLLAEGYRHVKDDKERVWNHVGGLILLAVVSECSYDLLEYKPITIESIIRSQNNIITLLLAFLGLIAIDYWKDQKLYMWATIILTAFLNYVSMSNYKFAGVLLVYAFYFYLNHSEGKNYLQRWLMILGIFLIYIPIYHFARCGFDPNVFWDKLKGDNTWWYLTHIPIAALLASYKGELGPRPKAYRIFYRWFYPAHLLVLGIIWHLM